MAKAYAWGARECFVAPGYEQFLQENPDWLERRAQGELRAMEDLPPWCIVSVDYEAFEMRTWAWCCLQILGYSDLATILNDTRRCPHIEMGTRLWDAGANFVEAPSWEDMYRWGYGLKKTDKKLLKEVRGVAKGPNFGLPGGMGAARLQDYCRLSYGVKITLEQAEYACKVWREIYREAQPYLDWVSEQIGRKRGSRGVITQFISQRVRGDVAFTEASNGFFQGLAADIAKAAGWRLCEEAYEKTDSPLYGCRPLAFVHDEWLYAIPRHRVAVAAPFMAKVMVDTAHEMTGGSVLFKAEAAAMYRWAKVAGDPYFDKDGLLIPYEERIAA